MPLKRFLLKSENGMSMQELYNEETVNNNEDDNNDIVDSKALLDSLSVSSLVSILRHLADLSQFAAEVFHGLQEQVAATASRSRKLASRVQQAEASLPLVEKAFLTQTSHMHYVYTPGCEWHARIRNEQNHFICDDLPHFIMDSYEECREPPRLHTLDRFDTGGPGSCLKRYSDPTFFKRASASSKVPNGEKLLDERNSRRIKRRRSRQQSGCFPDCVLTLDGSGRLQLSSSNFQDQFSVSQTGSTSDPTFKSDLRDKSDSPASKNGMGDFIEHVFHPSTSIQPDDTETTGLCCDLNKERVNEHVSIYLDEHTGSMGTHSPAMKATLLNSSSMRWDGKVEIVRPVGLNYVINDMQNIPEMNSYHNEQGSKHANAVYVKKDDGVSEHGSFLKSYGDAFNDVAVDWNQHDDNESETDHFVDALNTIESESESDFERHTNKEKVLISSHDDELLESTVNEQIKINHHEPKHGCHSLSCDNEESSHHDSRRSIALKSSANLESSDPTKSFYEESSVAKGKKPKDLACLSNGQWIQHIQSSSALDISQGFYSCANGPNTCQVAAPDSQISFSEKMIRTLHQPQEMPVALETNGVLVGLEPSKPTIFSILNTEHSDPDASTNVSDNELCETNNNSSTRVFSVSSGRDPGSYNSPGGSKIGENNKDDKFYEHMFSDSDQSNLCGHSVINGLNVGSLNYDYKPKTTSPWSYDSGNKSNDVVLHFGLETNLGQKLNSSQSSPPSSPPLEHMKISHRHIDVSETSRLTLKHPDGVDNHEISFDTFSSFQLIPESVNQKHVISSGSDDDTFGQSYDGKSDDYRTHLSDSNSEEWGTEDASEIDYNGLSNGLNRISLTESTSSSPQCGQTTLRRINVGASFVDEVHSESDRSSERPIMVAKDSLADQGMKVCSYSEADSSYFQQPTPQTPPLPPLQWRVSTLHLNTEGRKQDEGYGNLNQSSDADVSGPGVSHLAAMDSAKLLNSSDESVTVLKANKERDEPKAHFRNKFHQVVNEKRADEKGDFLHQIRTKSFNLRRTVPVRPTHTTSSATSNKVAAILQKANAIRRAVGSDGEDDSWSDTT